MTITERLAARVWLDGLLRSELERLRRDCETAKNMIAEGVNIYDLPHLLETRAEYLQEIIKERGK